MEFSSDRMFEASDARCHRLLNAIWELIMDKDVTWPIPLPEEWDDSVVEAP